MTSVVDQDVATEQHLESSLPDEELPPESPRRQRSVSEQIGRAIPVALVFGAFIGVWYLFPRYFMEERRRFLIPPPHKVVKKAFMERIPRDELLEGLGNTAKVALMGFGIASLCALVFAVAMALSRTMERAFFPYAIVLQTIPILALTPLFSVWFGPTRTARVVTAVLVALFPILTNFLFGLKSVDRGHRELFRLNEAGWWTRLWKLQFPAALPSIFTGLRIGAGLCVIGALVGDFFFTRGDLGLGRLMNNYARELQYERLIGGTLLASALGVTIYVVIGWIANRALRNWHESESRAT